MLKELTKLKNNKAGAAAKKREFVQPNIQSDSQGLHLRYTRKNAQLVTSLLSSCNNAVPTACQQDVFALPITRCCDRLVAVC